MSLTQRNNDFTAIARRSDGVMLGSADGAVCRLPPAVDLASGAATVASRTKICARGCPCTKGIQPLFWDRGQTSVTTIGADGHAQQALRAGQGATIAGRRSAGPGALIADTRGGQLLVYGVDPLIFAPGLPGAQGGLPAGRIPRPGVPTASNTVIGYDLTTGIPVRRQSVTHRATTQLKLASTKRRTPLYVVSGSGAGVQVIEHAAGTR